MGATDSRALPQEQSWRVVLRISLGFHSTLGTLVADQLPSIC